MTVCANVFFNSVCANVELGLSTGTRESVHASYKVFPESGYGPRSLSIHKAMNWSQTMPVVRMAIVGIWAGRTIPHKFYSYSYLWI
jgi:hypothetical protein